MSVWQDWDLKIAKKTAEIERINKTTAAGQNPVIPADIYIARGYAHCFTEKPEGKNYDKAISDFSRALSKLSDTDPQKTECYAKRAYAYYRKGLYDRAILDCKEATKDYTPNLTPDDWELFAFEILGAVYSDIGKYDDALINYEIVLSHNGKNFSLIERYREVCKKLRQDR